MKLKELCLEITNKCPMNCIHCSADAGDSLNDELQLEEIKGAIDEFSELGGEILEISGGEPTSHPHILDIISHARSHDLETRLYTSGFLLTESKVNMLLGAGLDKTIFNLQGPTEEIHEAITRTKGSFKNTIKFIKILRKKEHWVGVHFVPMKINLSKLEETVNFCINDLKVNEFAILRFVPQGRGLKNKTELQLSNTELIGMFDSMNRLNTEDVRIGRPFNIRAPCFNSQFEKCDAGISKCLIKPNGDVAPCPAFKQNNEYVIGNVRVESLSSIWESEKWNEFRYFKPEKLMGACKGCEHTLWCRGGCAAQRIIEHGSIYQGPDPSCTALKTKIKIRREQTESVLENTY